MKLEARGPDLNEEIEILIQQLTKRTGFKTWHIVLLADIISEKLEGRLGEILPNIKVEVPTSPSRVMTEEVCRIPFREEVTKTIDKKNLKFSGAKDFISVKGAGKLREFMLQALNKNIRIIILADGLTKLDGTYDELNMISSYLNFIDAFEENGKYIVHIKEISWTTDFLLTVSVEGETTFPRVFGIWDEIKSYA